METKIERNVISKGPADIAPPFDAQALFRKLPWFRATVGNFEPRAKPAAGHPAENGVRRDGLYNECCRCLWRQRWGKLRQRSVRRPSVVNIGYWHFHRHSAVEQIHQDLDTTPRVGWLLDNSDDSGERTIGDRDFLANGQI